MEELETSEEKECRLCGETKPLTEYYSSIRKNKSRGEYRYYFSECKKCSIQLNRDWRKNNPEKAEKVIRRYDTSQIGRERKKKHNRKAVESGKLREWQRNNKDKLKEYKSKRESKDHEISASQWEDCKNYFNNSCAYCGLHISEHFTTYRGVKNQSDLHKEHVKHDGANDLSNCVPSCKKCNSSKRKKLLSEWYNKETNKNYTEERMLKITKWLNEDYKKSQ